MRRKSTVWEGRLFRNPAGHRYGESLGIGKSPDIPRQVIVDPLTANLTAWGDRVVFIRLKQINIITPIQIIEGKELAGQKLV